MWFIVIFFKLQAWKSYTEQVFQKEELKLIKNEDSYTNFTGINEYVWNILPEIFISWRRMIKHSSIEWRVMLFGVCGKFIALNSPRGKFTLTHFTAPQKPHLIFSSVYCVYIFDSRLENDNYLTIVLPYYAL